MPTKHIQPPELFDSARFGYTQVVTATAPTTVHVSGQTALNRDFQIVGEGDLAAQASQALANLGHALSACGATASDVTSLRIYVVDYRPESGAALAQPLRKFFGSAPPAAQTLLGIQTLAMPGLLIEIEATAAVGG